MIQTFKLKIHKKQKAYAAFCARMKEKKNLYFIFVKINIDYCEIVFDVAALIKLFLITKHIIVFKQMSLQHFNLRIDFLEIDETIIARNRIE